ncbi:MAG: NlpC/P60 family protein [Actinomycetota bacterium]
MIVNGKIFRCLLISILSLLLVLASAPLSFATPVEEKRSQEQQVRSEIESINSELQAAIERNDEAGASLEKTNQTISENTEQLRQCEKNLNLAIDVYNQRLKGIYKYSGVSLIEVICGSKTINDLTQRFNLLNRIGKQDSRLVEQIRKTKEEINKREADLETAKARQVALVSQIEQERSRIGSSLSEKKARLSTLQGEISSLENIARSQSNRADPTPIQSIVKGNKRSPVGGVVGIAYAMIGVPYVYGGNSPDYGFDCSGLVSYCYAQVGIYLNRTVDYTPNLSWDELQPGDIVYSNGGRHVGIYTGGGLYIHAPYTGSYVKESPIYGFVGGYRP